MASEQNADIKEAEPSKDEFFVGESGIISVWDFDYQAIIDFQTKYEWAIMLCCPLMWLSALCCHPCYLNQNVEWKTRAQHLSLSVDGIRYVTDKHPTCCGFKESDKGKQSKTVPYDKITDCDVQEPAGTACCCCIDNVLYTVNVDTASGNRGGEGPAHELELRGLKNPYGFKAAVWAMKRGEVPVGDAAGGVVNKIAVAPAQEQMSTILLTEIRDELRKQSEEIAKLNATLTATKIGAA